MTWQDLHVVANSDSIMMTEPSVLIYWFNDLAKHYTSPLQAYEQDKDVRLFLPLYLGMTPGDVQRMLEAE
jgi:hypothetical protein